MPCSTSKASCHPDRTQRARGLCGACYRRIWNEKHPEAVRASWKRYRLANPEAVRASWKRYRLANPGNRRTWNWKQQGIPITYEEYQRRCAVQNGRCAICEQPSSLVPDHDHTTGKMRMLLCSRCNRGIGHLGDDPVRCRKAAMYLEQTY